MQIPTTNLEQRGAHRRRTSLPSFILLRSPTYEQDVPAAFYGHKNLLTYRKHAELSVARARCQKDLAARAENCDVSTCTAYIIINLKHPWAVRDTHDDPRAQGAPQGHSHHKKYRSQYPATTDAKSRERGANALWRECLCLPCYTHTYMSLQLCTCDGSVKTWC